MPDYRELYIGLFRKIDKAINLLIEAQQEAEEKVVNEDVQNIVLISDDILPKQENNS